MRKKTNIIILTSCLLLASCLMLVGSISLVKTTEIRNVIQDVIENPAPLVQPTFHADAGKPYSGGVNEYIRFDGSQTYINPAGSAIYEWDFGDGTTGFGKYIYHRFSKPGVYYTSLKVTTNNNEKYMDETIVYIGQGGSHLKPYGGCRYSADKNEIITFDASKSVSNEPDLPITQYIWYFGDGEKAYGKKVTHSYDTARVYLVTLIVKDSDGNTRYDFLHADIGCSYTSVYDCFLNVDSAIEKIINLLFNKQSWEDSFLIKYFDAKIYTNYNGYELYSDISSLPKQIDVNNNGVKDVEVDQIKFLEVNKGVSLFGDNTMIWYQFETTISSIKKLDGSDIKAEDDFTICFQVKFPSELLSYLDLDTPLLRIGYNSPVNEEMPDSVSLTHIFKPYVIPGMIFNNNKADSQQQSQTSKSLSTKSQEIDNMGISGINTQQLSSSSKEITMDSQEGGSYYSYSSPQASNFENGYYPEYGLRLTSSGGGKLSIVRMFLKSELEDDTGIILKTTFDLLGGDTSNMVFKMMKKDGIFHRGLKIEVPDDTVTVSVLRIENGNIKTEFTTDLFWNQEQTRKVFWDDEGTYLRFDSKVSAGLKNLYFNNQNPEMTLTLKEIIFTVSGSFELSLKEGIDIIGSASFALTNLSFTTPSFYAGIVGTLELSISKTVTFGLYKEDTELGLKIGSTDELILISNCIYKLNDKELTLNGDFIFQAGGAEIRFALDNDNLVITLEKGPSLDVQNLYFNTGDLTVTASKLNIDAEGRFEFEGIKQDQITVKLSAGIDLYFENVNLIYSNLIDFNIDGSVYVGSDGYITFAGDHLEAGLSGLLELGDNFNFEFNDYLIEINGNFEIASDGIFFVYWDRNQILYNVSQSQELSITDFHFNVYPITVEFSSANIHTGNGLKIFIDKNIKMFRISSSLSFDIVGFSFKYEGNNLCTIGGFSVNGGGNFGVSADLMTQIMIDFNSGISLENLVIEPSSTLDWVFQKFSVDSMSYLGDINLNILKTPVMGRLALAGVSENVQITGLHLEMLLNIYEINLEDLSFDGEVTIELQDNNILKSAKLGAQGSISLLNFDSDMDVIDFDISSLDAVISNSLLIAVGNGGTPSIQLSGGIQFDLQNLDLTIGSWYLKVPEAFINGSGDFTTSWDNTNLTFNIDQNILWDIKIDTTNLGDWETNGHLNADVDIKANKNGDSGYVLFDIYGSGVQYNIKIIHGALSFDLGTFNLDPGSIKFEWKKEQSASDPGYFNIINSNVEGNLTAFNVTYDDGSNPVIQISIINIEFKSGNTYFTWGINFNNFIEMDRSSTLDCKAFKFKWGSKIITLDVFSLQTGKFRVEWALNSDSEKVLKIKNSILNLGPGVTYEDTSQDLVMSANIGGLSSGYQTITLKCYKDTSGNVSGVYLDSGGANLANYITLSAVKSDIGVKITLGGLRVDGFFIKRNGSGEFEIGGKIYLVNNLTFSILKNNTWRNLSINWDVDLDGVGYFELEADPNFISEEEDLSVSARFKDVDITLTVEDITEYYKFGWDVDFDLQGYIQVDTNSDPLYEIGFEIKKDIGGYYPKWGVYIQASGIAAEDYQISWDFSKPPGEWVLMESGEILDGQINNVWLAWNSQWYDVLLNGQPI
jgi:hypothetical protein